jgi:hypothetical protein
MKLGISLLCFSILLQLSAAGRNFATVQEGIEESEKKTGPVKTGEIFVFKEWWASKPNNPADLVRGFSHVRTVVLEITGAHNTLAKGRAFDVTYYKLDANGQPATPTAVDQVINAQGVPAVPLYMETNDEVWYANRYRRNGQLVPISRPNKFRLVARNPFGYKTVEEIYTALRKRGTFRL